MASHHQQTNRKQSTRQETLERRKAAVRKKKTLEQKFHEKSWEGLDYNEKVELTKLFHGKNKGLADLDRELCLLRKCPDAHLPVFVHAELNKAALKNLDPALMEMIHRSYHDYDRTVVPLGLTKKKVLSALKKYEAKMS